MSVFKNVSSGMLTIQDENGRSMTLEKDQEFTGSNYYKRFVVSGNRLLKQLSDDGIPYPQIGPEGAVARPINIEAGPESTMDGNNFINVIDLIGGPATYADIATDNNVTVRINGDPESDFLLEANEIRRFDHGDILINTLDFANSDEVSAAKISGLLIGKPLS